MTLRGTLPPYNILFLSLLWAVLDRFPRAQARKWMGSGALEHKLAPIWDPGTRKARPLALGLWHWVHDTIPFSPSEMHSTIRSS